MNSSEMDRLGTPDYTGEWTSKWSDGEFEMYILNNQEWTIHDTSPVKHTRKVNEVTGVIFDSLGLSVFSGVDEGNVLYFTKTYSNAARQTGAFANIEYHGELDPELNEIRGQFTVPHENTSGEFVLRPAKTS